MEEKKNYVTVPSYCLGVIIPVYFQYYLKCLLIPLITTKKCQKEVAIPRQALLHSKLY